jgi:uncharacterized repeat protein (TIGR03803 family)
MRRLRSGLLLTAVISVLSLNSAQARGEKTLHSFAGGNDGDHPTGTLIMDASGNLLGTTEYGGASNAGTVFRMTPSGKEKELYTFTGGGDGARPMGGVIMDAGGNLYGTTFAGGAQNLGTVFKLTPHGKKKILHSFDGDTYNPDAPLVMDADGNLYGTTTFGGTADNGAVFKVTPKGQETILYSFKSDSDGYFPEGGLILDANGNLYGTTSYGGASGGGTVFKLTPDGQKTIIFSFTGGSDGSTPLAGLFMDDAGNLYGTTSDGGDNAQGVVFKVTLEGQETTLHTFSGNPDGGFPYARLIMDASGNIYGTTNGGGGGLSFGTVFKLTPAGKETVLHAFSGDDGAHLSQGLVMDARANLYGTAPFGGASNKGTVFKVGK